MSFCPNCGSQVPDTSKFCTNCGAAMAVAAVPAAPQQPAAPAQPAQQPAYQAPAQPAQQPAYQAPAQPAQQPAYQAPAQPAQQPAYQAPAQQPAYQAPAQQPAYQAPAQPAQQPAYQAPAQPAQQPAYQAPAQPARPAAPGGGNGGNGGGKKPVNKKLFLFGGIGLAVILVVVILIAALGGGGADADDPNLGMYNCVSCTSMGLDLGADGEWVELKAKGKADLYLFGEEYSAKWSLEGEDFVLTQGGDDYEGSLKNGVLTIDFAGLLYTYEKEGGAAPDAGKDNAADNKDDKPADSAAGEAGYWTLLYSEGDDPSMVMDEETVQMMKELGMEMYVVLNEDGSGVFSMEEPMDITWADGSISAEGESLSYKLEGEQLIVEMMGTTFVYVRGEGDAPGGAAAGPGEEPDEPDEPAAEGPYAWWDGEWYGWWIVQSGHGYYEEWEDYYWDAYARIDVDGETGWMDLWDVDTDADSPLASMEVYFTSGVSEHGTMRAESGYFMDYEIQHADWGADPGAMGFEIDDLIWIDFKYIDPTNEDDYMNVYVFLRPWGMSWDDIKGETDSSWPYDDMMPMYYDDWYKPLVEAGESLPDSYDAGLSLLGGGAASTGSGEVLAEVEWDDCLVQVMGAEAFEDDEGDSAIRVFYMFTNTSDELQYPAGLVSIEASQDGYDAEYAYPKWEEYPPEDGNDYLYVRPGVSILCCEEFFMKPDGGNVAVLFYNWWEDDEFFTIEFDPNNLPGRPAEFELAPITDPQWVLDLSDYGEADGFSIYIDSAELAEGWDGDVLRVYFEFTNNTGEATSPFMETSIYVFQDGVELDTTYAVDSIDSDNLYYEEIENGETVYFSICFELRNENPLEVQVNSSWSDVIAGVLFTMN